MNKFSYPLERSSWTFFGPKRTSRKLVWGQILNRSCGRIRVLLGHFGGPKIEHFCGPFRGPARTSRGVFRAQIGDHSCGRISFLLAHFGGPKLTTFAGPSGISRGVFRAQIGYHSCGRISFLLAHFEGPKVSPSAGPPRACRRFVSGPHWLSFQRANQSLGSQQCVTSDRSLHEDALQGAWDWECGTGVLGTWYWCGTGNVVLGTWYWLYARNTEPGTRYQEHNTRNALPIQTRNTLPVSRPLKRISGASGHVGTGRPLRATEGSTMPDFRLFFLQNLFFRGALPPPLR